MGHKIGQENRTKKIGQKIGHEQVGQNKSEKMGQKNRIKKIGHVEVGQKNQI